MTTATPRISRSAFLVGLAAATLWSSGCSESAPPSEPAPGSTQRPPATAASPYATPQPQAVAPAAAGAQAASSAATKTDPTPPTASDGAVLTVMGVRFPLPAGFRQVPPANQMRLAEVQVADASGDPSKVSTIAFSTAGGTVEANLDRWVRQVLDASGQPAKAIITQRETAGTAWSHIESTGSFVGMGEGPAKAEWMLRGAVVKLPKGLLFVKMTGPAEAMKAHGAGFDAMMAGMTMPQ